MSAPFPIFGSDKHNQLIERWNERFKFSESGKRTREKLGIQAYRHFRSHIFEMEWPFPAKVYDPHWYGTASTAIAREVQSICQTDPILNYEPRGWSSKDQAEKLTQLADYYMDKRGPREPLEEICQTKRLYGTAYVFVGHDEGGEVEADWVTDQVPYEVPLPDGTVGQITVPKQKLQKRKACGRPTFEPVHWTEAFPDHSEARLEDSEFFILRKMRDTRWLKRMAKRGIWNKKAVKQILQEGADYAPGMGGQAETCLKDTFNWQAKCGFEDRAWDQITDRQWFEVLECWTSRYVCVIVNRSYVVRYEPNPYAHGRKPFLHIKNISMSGEHYGMSDYEVVRWMIRALQTVKAGSASEVLLNLFPPLAVPRGERFKDARHSPQAVWRGLDPKKAQFMTRPGTPYQMAEQETQSYRYSMDNALGLSDAQRGQNPKSGTTATALNILSESAGLRTQFAIDKFEDQFTRPLGAMWASIIKQFMVEPVEIRDPEADEPILIYPFEVREIEAAVTPLAGANQARAMERSHLMQLFELGMKYGAEKIGMKPPEAFRMVFQAIAPKYVKTGLYTPEEMAQMAEEARAAAIQAAKQAELAKMQQAMQAPPPGGPAMPGGPPPMGGQVMPSPMDQMAPPGEMPAEMTPADQEAAMLREAYAA